MKKILSLLITIGMCFSLLVGCNLFSVNTDNYYNQIVATAGKHEFTMMDLLDAYTLYGSDYVENGSTYAEAIKQTMDDMIDRTLVVDYIKDNNLVVLDAADYNDIKLTVYESIQSSITSFEDQIKVERGISEDNGEDDFVGESGDGEETKEEYVSKFILDEEKAGQGIYDIKRVVEVDPNYGVDPGEFVQLVDIAYPDISTEAMRRYVKTLQSQARQYGRSDKEEDVRKYEYDRLTKVFTENKYISKLQESYYVDMETVKEQVVKAYVNQYASDYVTYNGENFFYNETMSGKSSSYAGDIYYHPEVNYMAVAHILLKYDTKSETLIKLADNKLAENNPEYTQDDYDNEIRAIAEGLKISYTENNTTKETNALAVFNRVQNEVINNIDSSNIVARTSKFYELMGLFNEDTGINDAEYGYIIPLNVELDEDDNTINGAKDSMIPEFADDSRALHAARNEGGNMSAELVLGSYGFHIIFNMGEIKNLFTVEEMQNYEQYFEKIWTTLHKTPFQVNTNETIFDRIYDGLDGEDSQLFNNYIQDLTNTAKSGLEIKKYESRYDDLWK